MRRRCTGVVILIGVVFVVAVIVIGLVVGD